MKNGMLIKNGIESGYVMDALILAGGKSSRMNGQHKGNLLMGTETFMERMIKELKQGVGQIWISYGENIHGTYEGCNVVVDEYMNCGPIGGIHAGLKQCQSELLFVVACDMPFFKLEFLEYLEEQRKQEERKKGICFDAVVPVLNGKINPLASIYRKRIISILEEQMKKKEYRLVNMLERMNVLYVDVSGEEKWEKMLQNINTINDYERMNI